MGLQLTISKGLQQGKEFLFEQAEVHIGRTSDNDVVLQDTGVSRRHVRISDRLGRFFVQPVDSAPGTQLNDRRLTGEQELRNGDRIVVGSAELVFQQVMATEDATAPNVAALKEEFGAPAGDEPDEATRPIRRTDPRPSAPPPPRRAPDLEDEMSAPGLEDFAPPAEAAADANSTRIGTAPERRPESSAGETRIGTTPERRPDARSDVAALETRIGTAPERRPDARSDVRPDVAEVSTRITAPPARRSPPAAFPEPEAQDEENSTRRITVAPARRAAPVADSTLQDHEPVPPKAEQAPLARSEPRAVAAPRAEPKAAVKAPASAARPGALDGLSAADRARRRRELGDTMGGQFQLWWADLSRGGRAMIVILGVLVVGGALTALGVVFRPHLKALSKGPEPTTLTSVPVTDSFGLGEGVKWEEADMKSFDFEVVSPTRAVAVIHYQASGISKEEVSLSVNAVTQGWMPPDTTNTSERELQQILPPSVLKRNETNTFVFDNVRNPPGRDSWRIWNLHVEIIPVPDLRPEELAAAARDYVAKGRIFYERRDVGAENLFLAWESYRSAWITLEALEDKPDLYQDVRYMLGQLAADLDQKCGQLILEFQRYIQFKDKKRAARVLQDINRRFPTPTYRCHNLAAEKASEYGL